MTAPDTYIHRCDQFVASLGYEAYRVGGSVRDQILGRRVKDVDYMIRGASLAEIGRSILKAGGKPSALKLRDGRQAGWRANVKGLGLIEIVLPRKEISTGPGHRDFEIVLDPALSIGEDAKRRDFTFNALYFLVPDGPVADPTARGLYDLEHRLVSTTHPDSFRDDPLRTLRALRFVAVLGHDLTAETIHEMVRHAGAVDGLTVTEHASGTVYDEMSKLLMGQDVAKALRLARDTGVLGTLFPELFPMLGFDQGSKYHDLPTCEHTFKALDTAAKVDAPLRVRWALLFHDCGKPETAWVGDDGRKHYYAQNPINDLIDSFDGHVNMDHEEYGEILWLETCDRMSGVPKDIRKDVAMLIRNHMVTVVGKVKGSKVRRARAKFGDELLRDLYLHRMCDISGKGKVAMNHMRQIGRLEEMRQEAQTAGVPANVRELEINGGDLMQAGITGAEIGRVLRAVLDEVVVDPQDRYMTKEWQMTRALALAKETP